MILLDANLLVYAHVTSLAQHRSAASWLDRQLNANAIVALPWQSLLSFARLVTNPRIFEQRDSRGTRVVGPTEPPCACDQSKSSASPTKFRRLSQPPYEAICEFAFNPITRGQRLIHSPGTAL
ncbi:MAG: hypothetical protein WB586_13370 [Chthoniobacterales bacterium]